MTDRSKIIRHPAVIHEEFLSIRRNLGAIRMRLEGLEAQLEQVADIAYGYMTGSNDNE